MSTDNRTLINDCEANTGWTGDDTANPISTAGSFIQGSGALSTQLSNADEHMFTTQDSVGASTFSLDWSDSTLYMNIKDQLGDSYANGGIQYVISDGTNTTGYDVAGNDAVGMPYALFFAAFKLDVSVKVASPGTNFTNFAGTEANLTQTAITGVGYGSLHLAKAVGSIDNVIMDGFYYIANDSYALTINGGTVGTPETMADVVGDDVASGWGLTSNPQGSQYLFFGPTEWGESAASADHYFTATGEQWYWMGDNAGGHGVGAGHMPYRVIGNATDTGSFVIGSVAIVSTGTAADFDCSDTNIDTLEIDTCSMAGLATFQAPSSGGTSRFCTDTIFSNCGVITHNGASMNGCSVLTSTVAADEGALFYNETVDPDGEMDGMTFTQGTNAHHAIRFGTSVPAAMTLRNCTFNGFSSSDDVNGSVFRFDDTSGSITLNLVGCTTDGTFSVDDAAGVTVTVVEDPVTFTVNTVDATGAAVGSATVLVKAANGTGPLPFEDSVTITNSTTTADVVHTAHGLSVGEKVFIEGANEAPYNGVHTIVTSVDADSYTYTMSSDPGGSATGTITSTAVIISGTSNGSGVISDTRTYSSAQPISGWARKSSSAPFFKEGTISGSISATLGLTTNAVMTSDE